MCFETFGHMASAKTKHKVIRIKFLHNPVEFKIAERSLAFKNESESEIALEV